VTQLPDLVLVRVLRYISIFELLTSVNRTCKTFYNLIAQTSVLWEHFEFEQLDGPLSISRTDLELILTHARAFKTFILPPLAVSCNGFDLDLLFANFLKSCKLSWLTLTDLPLSTLCFLVNTPNIEVLNLSGCTNLVDEDFMVLKTVTHVDQLYLSFTNISNNTLCEIVRGKSLLVLDVCGVPLTIATCHQVLSATHTSLITFDLSLDNGISVQDFNRQVKDVYLDTAFHIYNIN